MYVPNYEIGLKRNKRHGVQIKRASETGHGEVFVELDDATIIRLYEFMKTHRDREINEQAEG